nr:ABC transporter substrate-binding protein [Phascolarctobacterium succinatutens]
MALKPDLVILGDWWTPDSIQTIRDMGISVYVYKTPYTVADIKKAIREIADVVDAKQQGEAVIKEYDAKIAKAKAVIKAANIKQQKKIVVMSGHGVIGTKGSLLPISANMRRLIIVWSNCRQGRIPRFPRNLSFSAILMSLLCRGGTVRPLILWKQKRNCSMTSLYKA